MLAQSLAESKKKTEELEKRLQEKERQRLESELKELKESIRGLATGQANVYGAISQLIQSIERIAIAWGTGPTIEEKALPRRKLEPETGTGGGVLQYIPEEYVE